jgi:hypothetical protein
MTESVTNSGPEVCESFLTQFLCPMFLMIANLIGKILIDGSVQRDSNHACSRVLLLSI